MRRWSLRTKILLASSATLLALIGATLAYVSVQADDFVGSKIAEDLEDSGEVIKAAEAERFATLQLTAQVLASVPQLRALLENTDAATIRDVLRDNLQHADLLIVLSPTGQTLARSDAITSLDLGNVQARWIDPLLAGQRPTGFITTPNGVYHAAAEAAVAAGTVFGFLLAGARVDDLFAQRLGNATGEDLIVLADDQLLGSTIPAADLPWKTGVAWKQVAGARASPLSVTIAGEEYAVSVTPGVDAAITYLTLQSRDRALAPYRRIQVGLLALGAIAVAIGVGASALLARTVTAPVARLVEGTRQVAAGNFDFALDVKTQDELGTLAESFNTMTRGLRERADMQKFVSQSTMEMIQSPAHASAGERKRLTILFSDVRGFSRFAEQRPPEHAVEWLNKCLGLQADLVRKHNGDVDKFVGDAVLALFAGDDMAFDAVRCAVDIQRQMEKLDAPDGERLEVGIGIVTGEVILGSIGSHDRLDYTAIGNQVNLCSRLCAMAAPREILIADSTYALVRDLIAAERLESVAVRGIAQPVDVYRMSVAREK
ncbi:MAG: adenylate/guanylate cyclase domain-containing protein [Vicinamibacterales bacterium]